ncbi:MAG: 50S ribosomal protein L5 [archaeon]|nr:50S ribosomal protein L5 [archaeon]
MTLMKDIKVSKVVLNIGLGKNVDRLDSAMILAERLTGCKPVKTLASRKAKTFKIGRGRVIGVKVTMRGSKSLDFLKKLFQAKGNTIKKSSFDREGNFNFGFEEYLEIPGVKYDPSIGIMGFNISVTLERPGFRIKRRKIQKRKIPMSHRISGDESVVFIKKKFGVEII